tara:strand:+ start:47328 stop:47852 length:525 start_codon:yes stop_codon:yes gene_type:complete
MKYYTLFFSVFLFFNLLFTNKSGASEKDSIVLTGLVFNNKDRVKNVVINIYNKNKLWKTVYVKSSNRFKTNLPLNETMTIEITAEKFYPKRFIFDTSVPNDLKSVPNYDFDIDIFSEKELEGVNTSFLDFPVGIVTYDPKKKEFERDIKYTKKMKKAYLKLWEEAQTNDRASFE